MLKLTNLRLPLGADEESLVECCARVLGRPPDEIRQFQILRRSLDVRKKDRLEHVYTAAVALDDERSLLQSGRITNLFEYHADRFEAPLPGERPLEHRPIVVGTGPAGMFAAYLLAEHGYRPLILERGQPVARRIEDVRAFDAGGPHDPESNYLFGEGGAGTFSDGKLTCRRAGPDRTRVLEIFAQCKGKPSILYDSRPHLGSNRLPAVVKAIRRQIQLMGGEYRFGCRVEDLCLVGGRVVGVETSSGRLAAEVVVLATGHSARDTYAMLANRGVLLEAKPFQMGVRIEQPQEQIDRAQYGRSRTAPLLGPADYTMKVHAAGQDLFTFCMCAGGYVMPSISEPGHFCTNGMSRSGHESPFANSGLVVTVDPRTFPGEDPLRGMRYQAAVEARAYHATSGTYHAPIQWAIDFLSRMGTRGTPPSSYRRGVEPANLWELIPPELAASLAAGLPLLDSRWHGLFLRGATLVAPESRGSAPVRIVRDPLTRESVSVAGLYPVGEGAGYAGGIVSAAVDGLQSAKAIIRVHRPLDR